MTIEKKTGEVKAESLLLKKLNLTSLTRKGMYLTSQFLHVCITQTAFSKLYLSGY